MFDKFWVKLWLYIHKFIYLIFNYILYFDLIIALNISYPP